jgi:hypothetical protein
MKFKINILDKKKLAILGLLLLTAAIAVPGLIRRNNAIDDPDKNVPELKIEVFAKNGKVKSVSQNSLTMEVALSRTNPLGVAEAYYEDRLIYITPDTEIVRAGLSQQEASRGDIRSELNITVYSGHNLATNTDVAADKIEIQ